MATTLLGVAALSCFLGCDTAAGRTHYLSHLSSRVTAGPAANEDVAVAFRLGPNAQPETAVVAAPPAHSADVEAAPPSIAVTLASDPAGGSEPR